MSSTPQISDAHQRAAQLIPWLVNGTLAGEEAAELRAHLSTCERCRADLEAEERLCEAIRAEGPLVLSGEPSLEKLLARIEADDLALREAQGARPRAASEGEASVVFGYRRPADRSTGGAHRGTPKRRGSRRSLWRSPASVRWLAAAVMIETLGLGLGAWIWRGGGTSSVAYTSAASAARAVSGPYRTLTTPSPRYDIGPRARVVFRADLSLEHLQKLLQRVGAHIVDGPTEAHVYTLGFGEPLPAAVFDTRLAALRADPSVLFAEPASERSP